MKKLKIISLISAALLLAFSLSACVFKSGDPVIASLGKAMSVQRYSCAGFGDSTDFGIYTFPGASPGKSEYFKPVTADEPTVLHRILVRFSRGTRTCRNVSHLKPRMIFQKLYITLADHSSRTQDTNFNLC